MLPLLLLLAASSTTDAVNDVMAAAKLFAQGTLKKEDIPSASAFWRSRVVDASTSHVEAVRFYTPTSLPLRLRHLASLGPWKPVHQSKSSSVLFTYCVEPKRCAAVYVQLLHIKPDSPVTSIRVSTLKP